MRIDYAISEVRPYINWMYFFHAWGLNGKPQQERDALQKEADTMLDELGRRYHTHAIFHLFEAYSDGDDILIRDRAAKCFRLPMLRQQHGQRCACHPQACLCLADFIGPQPSSQALPQTDSEESAANADIANHIGIFAATVDAAMECDYQNDDYLQLLVQTLADRLAEATVERLHEQVRRNIWGYAPDEHLSMAELHREHFQGIRPAVGYPSLPDVSLNFLIDELIDMQQIGIRLTESGMMMPHASVSGLMLAHPAAHYFDIGPVGEDQLQDYAQRRGMTVKEMRRFLK